MFVLLCRLFSGVHTGVIFVSKGGQKEHLEKCMSTHRNIDDGYLATDCVIDFATSQLGDRAEDHVLLNCVFLCVIVVWKTESILQYKQL
jgi:hypothetical protein